MPRVFGVSVEPAVTCLHAFQSAGREVQSIVTKGELGCESSLVFQYSLF